MSRLTRPPVLIRLAALGVLLAGLAFWFSRGAHVGWTRTSVTTMETDAITGLEYPVQTDRFIPGVEYLLLLLLAAGMVAALSFWPRLRRLGSSDSA